MTRLKFKSGPKTGRTAGTMPSGDKTVLTPSDFTYLGMVRVPVSDPTIGWAYGSATTWTTRRVGGNLHIISAGSTGGGRTQPVYETVYPGSPSLTQSTAPRMTIYKDWGNIYDNKAKIAGDYPDWVQINGFSWDADNDALIWAYGAVYDAQYHPTICATRFNGTSSFTTWGSLRTTAYSKQSNGHLCSIPSRHRSTFGGRNTLVGGYNTSINAGNTFGFSAQAFNAATLIGCTPDSLTDTTQKSLSSTEVMQSFRTDPMNRDPTCQRCLIGDASTGYSCEIGPTTIFPPDTTMTDNDSGVGICWIDNTTKHGVVNVGSFVDAIKDAGQRAIQYNGDSIPHYWYGPAGRNCCHGHLTSGDGTGPHAASTIPQMWIYDPQLYLDVANGIRTSKDIANMPATKHRHFYEWSTTMPYFQTSNQCGGGFYDPVDRLFFIVIHSQDYTVFEPQPVLHVFQVAD